MTSDWAALSVDHFVVHTDASVGQIDAQFVAELPSDNHWLGHHFSCQWVNFAGVDDLVIHCHDGTSNEIESIGVVRHGEAEMVVSWHGRARVPCTLDAEITDVKRLTALIR